MARNRPTLIATCYDKRGRKLSSAKNSWEKTHPLMLHLAKKTKQNLNKIYLHAEVAALLKAGDKQVYKLTIERYGKTGKPLNAAPCPICSEALKIWGVSVVQYTVG